MTDTPPENGKAMSLEFPVSETPSSSRVPKRIRKRLLAECKAPSTVEEIEAKLQHADLRRQKFYESVSSKGKSTPRSSSNYFKQFLKQRKTTLQLAKAFDSLKINENSAKSTPFEQLVLLIESVTTLQTVKTLLERIESRVLASTVVAATDYLSGFDNIDHLLERVANKVVSMREASDSKSIAKLSRYPVRVALCAYMILGHPDEVLSSRGEQEIVLAKSAEAFVQEFELLVKVILDGPVQSADEESDSALPKRLTFRSQLVAFDKAWCSYLNCFAMWKVKDAQLMEEDLVRAACQLELSMIQKCKLIPEGDTALNHATNAIQRQVIEDQNLLREKVQHLSGDAGIERMECALSEIRTKTFQAKGSGIPMESPITPFLSLNRHGSSSSLTATTENKSNLTQMPNRVVSSLFKEDGTSPSKNSGSSVPSCSNSNVQLGSSIEKQPVTENELIVNEFLHERCGFVDSFNVISEDQNSIKAKVRETMEKAFWDSIMESMRQDEPNYDRVIDLVREVRDEICEMVPQSWREETIDSIDLDILSQVLKSGNLDIDYLGRILGFALITLQKLSSPANDDEIKAANERLLKELAEICDTRDKPDHFPAFAMIKGLRFVLEQIQDLKREISKARIKMMEPLLKGPAGLDYLRKAFANRYGSPSDAYSSLPLTMRWLSSIWNCKDQEWAEHQNSLSTSKAHDRSSQGLLPSFMLKTGGSYNSAKASQTTIVNPITSSGTGHEQPECKGETVDILVRLGLLKLVSGVSGLTPEALPETLMLNLSILRGVQAEIQKITVISTSILICRQILMSEQVIADPTELETVISNCTQRLSELLDHVEDVGIEGIVEIISVFSRNEDKVMDDKKLQTMKIMMARMLAKSLQAGDAVFEKVSRAIYLAFRGIVFGGSGAHGGEKLAEIALRQVGACSLTERVVKAAEMLVLAATVSISVHGQWYVTLMGKM